MKNGSIESRITCSEGASLLKYQVKIFNYDDIINYNPFEVTDSDVDETNTETNIINESDNEDHFTDIE